MSKEKEFSGFVESGEVLGPENVKVFGKKSLIRKDAIEYAKKIEKRGVIYLSRIPPFMKPNKVRSIFEQYGEVTRLYLQEEDVTIRKRRKKSGGNGSKQFTEGWVEFSEKSIAKNVAESLNNTNIGSKKGDFYHDDIWNIKYLKKFKCVYTQVLNNISSKLKSYFFF